MTFFRASVLRYPAGWGKIKLDSNISVTYFRIWTVILSDSLMLLEFTTVAHFLKLQENLKKKNIFFSLIPVLSLKTAKKILISVWVLTLLWWETVLLVSFYFLSLEEWKTYNDFYYYFIFFSCILAGRKST